MCFCFGFLQLEGYKFDPYGEYVRRWLPELSRLPTEWIHHPWNAPESVLQAAGIELGSNYPLPIVGLDAAKARLEEALSEMWQQEAASRAAIENGTEEGLGDSSESIPIAFPEDILMEEEELEPARTNAHTVRCYEDQMVPSITSSVRLEDEPSLNTPNTAEDGRAEVPTDLNLNQGQEPTRNALNPRVLPTAPTHTRLPYTGLRAAAEHSTADSSSSSDGRRERDGGVVPVWSPPSSSYAEQFVVDENGIGTSSSFLQGHQPTHQIINWRRLSQTG